MSNEKLQRIKKLKREMHNIMTSFKVRLTGDCPNCGVKIDKETNQLELVCHVIDLLSYCPVCKKDISEEVGEGLYESMINTESPRFQGLLMDTYCGIVEGIHSQYDYGELETNEATFISNDYEYKREGWEAILGYNEFYAFGVIKTYTSFELFLCELMKQKVRECVENNIKVQLPLPSISGSIIKVVRRINEGGKNLIVHLGEYEYDLAVCDKIKLLHILGVNPEKLDEVYSQNKGTRNRIIHQGEPADFKDYAKIFVTAGKLFGQYDKLIKSE